MGGRAELVFIPCAAVGHLLPAVEVAKVLVDRDEGLSVAVLVMKLPDDSSLKAIIDSISASSSTTRIRFIEVTWSEFEDKSGSASDFLHYIEGYKPNMRDVVHGLVESNSSRSNSPRLAGFVIDMVCATMIDVANEIGVPSYLFFTSSATFLGAEFHLQALQDVHLQDISQLIDSDVDIDFPGFANPLPLKVLLPNVQKKDVSSSFMFLQLVKKFREAKGIIVNTFEEVDSRAIEYVFDDKLPKLYTVGPVLNMNVVGVDNAVSDNILKWLDDQPPASVVFLCFGSMGCFGEDQVRQIAQALEKSGHRFLWSLRRPPPRAKFDFPSSYENPGDVLPEGFLDRTATKGKVIGWAPQGQVLAHPAVGGFVSHCGWNSVLESIWFGVPIAAWPMHSEQHFNAFVLVEELGVAVEIGMDYRRDYLTGREVVVLAKDIERGIRRLMEIEREEKKEKLKHMSHSSREAVMEGGSSHLNLGRFITEVYSNITCQ